MYGWMLDWFDYSHSGYYWEKFVETLNWMGIYFTSDMVIGRVFRLLVRCVKAF